MVTLFEIDDDIKCHIGYPTFTNVYDDFDKISEIGQDIINQTAKKIANEFASIKSNNNNNNEDIVKILIDLALTNMLNIYQHEFLLNNMNIQPQYDNDYIWIERNINEFVNDECDKNMIYDKLKIFVTYIYRKYIHQYDVSLSIYFKSVEPMVLTVIDIQSRIGYYNKHNLSKTSYVLINHIKHCMEIIYKNTPKINISKKEHIFITNYDTQRIFFYEVIDGKFSITNKIMLLNLGD